ncbi:Vps52 like protein [Aduncisulcus paluster]|uniref:Vps52 like protein n=1 Tax=Aduncisulcus paluster TaxID=2918883 RepID=A0ABQ5K5C8_9EUKA|nr:Vps52 like protein [Aduncisulcus paluster]
MNILKSIADEIGVVQKDTFKINQSLSNRRVVHAAISDFLDSAVCTPSVIHIIVDGPIDTIQFPEALKRLSDKIIFIQKKEAEFEHVESLRAIFDAKKTLMKLTDVAIDRIKNFLFSKLDTVSQASSSCTFHIELLSDCRSLVKFLELHAPDSHREFIDKYTRAIRKKIFLYVQSVCIACVILSRTDSIPSLDSFAFDSKGKTDRLSGNIGTEYPALTTTIASHGIANIKSIMDICQKKRCDMLKERLCTPSSSIGSLLEFVQSHNLFPNIQSLISTYDSFSHVVSSAELKHIHKAQKIMKKKQGISPISVELACLDCLRECIRIFSIELTFCHSLFTSTPFGSQYSQEYDSYSAPTSVSGTVSISGTGESIPAAVFQETCGRSLKFLSSTLQYLASRDWMCCLGVGVCLNDVCIDIRDSARKRQKYLEDMDIGPSHKHDDASSIDSPSNHEKDDDKREGEETKKKGTSDSSSWELVDEKDSPPKKERSVSMFALLAFPHNPSLTPLLSPLLTLRESLFLQSQAKSNGLLARLEGDVQSRLKSSLSKLEATCPPASFASICVLTCVLGTLYPQSEFFMFSCSNLLDVLIVHADHLVKPIQDSHDTLTGYCFRAETFHMLLDVVDVYIGDNLEQTTILDRIRSRILGISDIADNRLILECCSGIDSSKMPPEEIATKVLGRVKQLKGQTLPVFWDVFIPKLRLYIISEASSSFTLSSLSSFLWVLLSPVSSLPSAVHIEETCSMCIKVSEGSERVSSIYSVVVPLVSDKSWRIDY